MRKRVKKSLSFLMALAMIVSVFCGSGMFVDAEDADDTVIAAETEGGETGSGEVDVAPGEGDEAVIPEDNLEQQIPEVPREPDTDLEDATAFSLEDEDGETTIGLLSTGARSSDTDVTSLSHEKFIKPNSDGTYDLTLTVAGAAGSSTQKKKLDVLLILDRSGSMKWNMAGSNSNSSSQPYYTSRWYNAKLAIAELIGSLDANTNLDTMYNIVTFSGSKNDEGYYWNGKYSNAYNDASSRTTGWKNSSSFVLSETIEANRNTGYNDGNGILDDEPNGGTNYQAGFREGKNQLANAREDAQKVVIFLSDGKPTYYYDSYGRTTGSGSSDADENNKNPGSCSDAAYKEAEGITNADFFYTIGLGDVDKIDLNVLTTLSQTVERSSVGCTTNTDNAPFMCGALEELKAAFAQMVGEINRFTCSNVTVTDNLSENVNMIGGAGIEDVAADDFTITVTDKDGQTVPTPEGISASYDKESRRIVLDFPDDYELQDGYVYAVTFKVQPSDIAYQKYAENGGYGDIGETGTGVTSEGKEGFFSNDSATVSYTYKGDARTEYYSKPVVQVNVGKITITKKVTGLPGTISADKKFEFTISSNGAIAGDDYGKYLLSGSGGQVEGNVLTLGNGESATFIYKAGTNFTFTEDMEKAKVADYDLAADNNGVVSGNMSEAGTALTMENAYQPSNRTLTVKKLVDGNMGDTQKAFAFTLALKKDNQSYTEALEYSKKGDSATTLNSDKGVYKFELKHGEEIELTIPYGCEYTITETKLDYAVNVETGNDTAITVDKANAETKGTLNADTIITYKNTRSIHTPTGVIRTMTPFFLMFAAAFGTAVFLILHRRKRFF